MHVSEQKNVWSYDHQKHISIKMIIFTQAITMIIVIDDSGTKNV